MANPSAYAAWVRQVAVGLSAGAAAVILEPDALATLSCLSPSEQAQRLASLRGAVDVLTADPKTTLYVDAGNSHWLPLDVIAQELRMVDISRARGFSLNVSNFGTTAQEDAYGEELSGILGGLHYVVDTSRDGLGAAPASALSWCNPPGRALGTEPTSQTGAAHADAYLWVKTPGESDGECHAGDPPAGDWFNSYALELVANRP